MTHDPSAIARDEPDQIREGDVTHEPDQIGRPDQVTRPAPIVTDDSAVFWDAADDGRLVAQRCADCGALRHPPRPMCPRCRSLAIDVVTLAGTGTVYSYAILHHPQNPAFDYPVFGVLVDLDEGIRLMSNLVDVAKDDIRVGMRVEVCFVETVGAHRVPVFRPIAGAS